MAPGGDWRGVVDGDVPRPAVAVELGILVAAPMSERRYGLFMLIAGQVATLIALVEVRRRGLDAVSAV